MNSEVQERQTEKMVSIDTAIKAAVSPVQTHESQLNTYRTELQRLRADNERYRAQFDAAPIGYLTVDRFMNILEANTTGGNILGNHHEHDRDQPLSAYIRSDDHDRIQTHINAVVAGNKATLRTTITTDGKSTPVMLYSTPVHVLGSDTCLCQTAMMDVSEHKAAEDQLRKANDSLQHTTHHDSLTSLPNRLFFNARFDNALLRARHTGKKVALLLLDINRFKNVNESLGHEIGDLLLKEVAQRLQHTVRDCDTVARLGDDEFTVVLEQIESSEEVSHMADKIIKALALPYDVGSHEICTAASIGVSIYPEDSINNEEMIRFSHVAMDRAKTRGSNYVQFFTAELNSAQRKRFKTESDLRIALRESQFELYFQPQLDLCQQRVVGYEALIRWNHPEKGVLRPDSFIQIAEETGIIEPLGEWILTETCLKLKQLREAGIDNIRMSVNVSAKQFTAGNLQEKIAAILEKTGTPGHALELELTESALLDNTARSIKVLRELRDEGIELSIDDFGTGYSSFSRLRELPLSRIKIDRSFVRGIPENQEDNSIVKAIICVAHEMGMQVVAEGVENYAQAEFLSHVNCDLLQGYHIGRPMQFCHVVSELVKNQ